MEDKNCHSCGKILNRKRFPSGLEDLTRFYKRKYCNRTCMASGMLKEQVGRSGYQRQARKLVSLDKCSLCGKNDYLEVHHKDENWSNNSIDNLQVLCHPCHMKHHWRNGKKMPKTLSVCKICGNPARRLDLCQKHYFRLRRTGNPLLVKKKVNGSIILVNGDSNVPNAVNEI